MSERLLEAVIWCPKCGTEAFRVYRERAVQEGVYIHVVDPKVEDTKRCRCGGILERL